MDLQWRPGKDGKEVPYSESYEDSYYSLEGGLAEAREVFIAGNRIPERWQSLQRSIFSLAELGFGTGLNFCALLYEYKRQARSFRLHYAAVEKNPLSREQIDRAVVSFPELREEFESLLRLWPELGWGVHRLEFLSGQVILDLHFCDVKAFTTEVKHKVDAWFLDGFAPSKNMEMWDREVLAAVARQTGRDGTFSTFTSVGQVRRDLHSAGFEVRKVPGFGNKRERLEGVIRSGSVGGSEEIKSIGRVAVVGAGMAGIAVSRSLAKRGVHVSLFDVHSEVCSKTSSVPSAIAMPAYAIEKDPICELSSLGFEYTLRLILEEAPEVVLKRGLFRSASGEGERTKWERVRESLGLKDSRAELLDQKEARKKASSPLCGSVVNFRDAICLSPKELCDRLYSLMSDRVEFKSESRFEFSDDRDWDHVIWTTGLNSGQYEIDQFTEVVPLKGEMFDLGSSLDFPLMQSDSVVLPTRDGKSMIGATFHRYDTSSELDRSQFRDLWKKWSSFSGHSELEVESNGGWVGHRAATIDTLPLVGRLPNPNFFNKRFADYHQGRYEASGVLNQYEDELFHDKHLILTALGSKGLTYSFLCAEILVSELLGEPLPVDSKLRASVQPERFLLRHLKKHPSHRVL